MKKIISMIIVTISFLSIVKTTFAEEGYIEKLLDLNYGVEEYNLNLESFDYIYFNDQDTQNMFSELDNINDLLKGEIMNKYREGAFDYYQVNGIISAHKKFIYHSNKLFYYISLKEQGYRYEELDDAILTSYKNVRSYYRKVKTRIY